MTQTASSTRPKAQAWLKFNRHAMDKSSAGAYQKVYLLTFFWKNTINIIVIINYFENVHSSRPSPYPDLPVFNPTTHLCSLPFQLQTTQVHVLYHTFTQCLPSSASTGLPHPHRHIFLQADLIIVTCKCINGIPSNGVSVSIITLTIQMVKQSQGRTCSQSSWYSECGWWLMWWGVADWDGLGILT